MCTSDERYHESIAKKNKDFKELKQTFVNSIEV